MSLWARIKAEAGATASEGDAGADARRDEVRRQMAAQLASIEAAPAAFAFQKETTAIGEHHAAPEGGCIAAFADPSRAAGGPPPPSVNMQFSKSDATENLQPKFENKKFEKQNFENLKIELPAFTCLQKATLLIPTPPPTPKANAKPHRRVYFLDKDPLVVEHRERKAAAAAERAKLREAKRWDTGVE